MARERNMPVEKAIEKWLKVAEILAAAAGSEGAPKDFPVKADLVKYRVPWIMTEPTNKGGAQPMPSHGTSGAPAAPAKKFTILGVK